MVAVSEPHFVICIPVYNDWEAATALLGELNRVFDADKGRGAVLFVDDGSDARVPEKVAMPLESFQRVEVLKLRRNLGHQRAIAMGLAFIHQHRPCKAVVVMDGDGQDAPEDARRLLTRFEEINGAAIVFAKRTRRAESVWFSVSYRIFKWLHWLLTGRRVEVGNFSVIPFAMLSRLMAASELWNHYAASVYKLRLPSEKIPIPRCRRSQDKSKMNVVGLVMHGLSAISVFSEEMGVRLLIGASVVMAAAGAAVIFVAVVASLPNWLWAAMGLLVMVLLTDLVLAFVFVFMILQRRNNADFLPLRDYAFYVMGTIGWHEQ